MLVVPSRRIASSSKHIVVGDFRQGLVALPFPFRVFAALDNVTLHPEI